MLWQCVAKTNILMKTNEVKPFTSSFRNCTCGCMHVNKSHTVGLSSKNIIANCIKIYLRSLSPLPQLNIILKKKLMRFTFSRDCKRKLLKHLCYLPVIKIR